MTVQSEITRISGAKTAIASAVEASGVTVPDGTKVDALAPLVQSIVGQFSDELDEIIGADTTPIPDAIAWADRINGEDVSGGSAPVLYTVTDIGDISTGFNATGEAGERMVWENGERYPNDPIVKDENGDEIPLLTDVNLGSPYQSSYVFIMPQSNVTVDFSSSGGIVGGGVV